MCVTRQKSASQTSVLKGGEGTFILPRFDARPVVDAPEPKSRISFCGTTRNYPTHNVEALACAQYPSRGARERANPK
jgi:hypothetical protein